MGLRAALQSRPESPKQAPAVLRSTDAAARGLEGTRRFGVAPPIVSEVLNSPGKALDPADREALSARLRHDFTKVRVHADSRAAASARAVDAAAYTVGSHVVFDDGKYAPRSSEGQSLLAHELVHTLQQGAGVPRSGTIPLADPADQHEKEAARLGSQAFADKPAAADSPQSFRVQRQMNPAPKSNFDLAESASPFLAGAIGSVTVDGFVTGKAEIPEVSQSALARTARTIQTLLKKYPGSEVRVIGHTDAVGKEDSNQALGQARADSVQAALIGLGIPAEAIVTESKGETQLLIRTKQAEARNRRAEVRFRPHTTPSFDAQAQPPPTQPSRSFGGGPAVHFNSQSDTRPSEAGLDAPSGHASPVPSLARIENPPAVGEIRALTEAIKKTAAAVKRDPLVQQLRAALVALQPVMPAKDARRAIDNAIDALVKAGSDAGIMAILQGLAGRSPSPVTDQQRQQTGPAVSQIPATMIPGPKLDINDAPKPAPKFSFQYRNGLQKAYAPGATIKFTLIAPDNFSTLPGAKHLVIVAEADRNAVNPARLGRVLLETASPQSIEMTAPQVSGKFLFRVDVGLGFDYSSFQEFEVTGAGKK
jgi:outer membrane protein OmpA-like peptidoglycan-associated protein